MQSRGQSLVFVLLIVTCFLHCTWCATDKESKDANPKTGQAKKNVTSKAASWKRKQVTAWKWQGGNGCQGGGCRRPIGGGCTGGQCRGNGGGCTGGQCGGGGGGGYPGGCTGGQCGGGGGVGGYPGGCTGGQCGGGKYPGGGGFPGGCTGGQCGGGGGGGGYPGGCTGGQCGGGGGGGIGYPNGCQGGQCGGGRYPGGCTGGQCGGGGGGGNGGCGGCVNYGVGYSGNPYQNYNQWNNNQNCYNQFQQGDCGFYSCYNQQNQCPTTQNYCMSYGQPYCQRSNQWYNSYNQQGQNYIGNVQRCQMGALNPGGGQSCSQINQQGYGSLIGMGNQQSCYWQGGQFCNVINNPQNCQALYNNYQGTGYTDYCIYRSMNNLASQCGTGGQQNFQQYYGNPYMQNLQQSGVNYGAYNTHYNQNYGQHSWKK